MLNKDFFSPLLLLLYISLSWSSGLDSTFHPNIIDKYIGEKNIIESLGDDDNYKNIMFSHASQNPVIYKTLDFHFTPSKNNRISDWILKNQKTQVDLAEGPEISFWYGNEQHFGALGQPQPWVNILGNVTDTVDINSFYYTLNGGSLGTLSIGPDGRRLEYPGDFNIDIATEDLLNGENHVRVTGVNAIGETSEITMTIVYTSSRVWPSPYYINWGSINEDNEILRLAQVVDGLWTITPDGLRTVKPGYDRLIGIGDRTWKDYEVRVPITLHSDFFWDSGVGLVFRWDGHTNNPYVCDQPRCGWLPLGDIGWMTQNGLSFYFGETINRAWFKDRVYMMVMRVESRALESTYSLKVWDTTTEQEPSEWQLTRTTSEIPFYGSILLIAHQADVTFGNVLLKRVFPKEIYLPIIYNFDL